MPIDDWTTVASADDALVADLLLGLKHSSEKAVSISDSVSGGLATFRWGRRKVRSRFGTDKEYTKRATGSPTTPLSWSGGASGNSDGYVSSSVMCCRSAASRSKTYAKLKEEERSLLQESQILKRDLATMPLTIARQKITNKSLKRIRRVNVHSKRMNTSIVVGASKLQGMPSPFTPYDSRYDIPQRLQASISYDSVPAAKGGGESFLLPDLNELPSIDGEPF